MKRNLSTLIGLMLLAFLPNSLIAQDNDLKINLNPGGKNKDKASQKTSFTSLFGLGPTFVSFQNEDAGTVYPEFKPFSSWSTDLGLQFRTRLGGPNSKAGIVIGLLWRYINIETDQAEFSDRINAGTFTYNSRPGDYRNSELNVHTLSIPLLLDFSGEKWGFAAGGFFGWRVGNSSEIDFKNGRRLEDTTLRDDFGLSKTLYGLTGQVGHKRVRIYANYYLNNLFATTTLYDVRVVQAGLCFQ